MKKRMTINSLALNISTDCQRQCSRCYGHLMNAPTGSPLMDLATAKKAAELFFANIDPEAGGDFMFFGGEPMLNWELMEEFIPWFQSLNKRDNVVLFTITNGIDLTPERIDFQWEHKVRPITVSLDGDFAIHSKVKHVSHAEFDHIIAMIKYGAIFDPMFMIPHCVIKKQDIPDLYRILTFIASLGVKWINLGKDLTEDWTQADRQEIVRHARRVIAETGVTIQPFSECIFDCKTCFAPSIMVYPNGDIYDSCYCMASVARDRGLIDEEDCRVMHLGNVNSAADGLYIDLQRKREVVRQNMECHLVDEDIYVSIDKLYEGTGVAKPYFRVMDVFDKFKKD